MSGGGDKNKQQANGAAAAPASQPMMTVQPSMPGQLEAIAQQLGAGFGQSAPDMMAYLQQFYKPMQVPDYSPRPATTPTPAPAPTTTGGVKRGGQAADQSFDRMIFNRQRGGGS